MARILAIDYGGKRTGLAVTDPQQIIATGLDTIESKKLIAYLKKYFLTEAVELIIIGLPKNWDDTDTHGTAPAEAAIKKLQKEFIVWFLIQIHITSRLKKKDFILR